MEKYVINYILSVISYFIIVLIVFGIGKLLFTAPTSNIFKCAFGATVSWMIFRAWRNRVERKPRRRRY